MRRLPSVLCMLALCFTLIGASLNGQSPEPGKQVEQSFQGEGTASVPYLLYLPEGYGAGDKPWPLMLFLHGRGESDGPLSLVAKWGPPRLVTHGEQLPYILISPQCPRDDAWSNASQQKLLLQLLDSICAQYAVDPDRIYLTGLSMGGSGSWRMAADQPSRFAAVVPICGRGDPADAGKLKSLPIWTFVGDQDRVFQPTVDMVTAIRDAGGKQIRLTTLENIGHNSWSAAYATPDLYQWLNQQQRRAQ